MLTFSVLCRVKSKNQPICDWPANFVQSFVQGQKCTFKIFDNPLVVFKFVKRLHGILLSGAVPE